MTRQFYTVLVSQYLTLFIYDRQIKTSKLALPKVKLGFANNVNYLTNMYKYALKKTAMILSMKYKYKNKLLFIDKTKNNPSKKRLEFSIN